jgi:hypothetical protein
MNQQLSPSELATLTTAILVLTKRDKLMRLAHLVRACPHSVFMFSNVEHMTIAEKRMSGHPNSAFSLAANDMILKDAGMQGSSVADGERFFELSRDELHAFSCDCGGHIGNERMARRIELIAA